MIRRRWFVMLGALCGFMTAVVADAGDLRIAGGFVETEGVLVAPASGESRLMTKDALAPGYYQFTAEYKTEGFEPTGRFAVDVKTGGGGVALSPYEWACAIPDWAPLVVCFRVSEPSPVAIRVGNWQQAVKGGRALLRNVAVRPFLFKSMDGANWLDAAGFDGGKAGSVPPNWYGLTAGKSMEGQSLVSNATFRSGAYILRLAGDGTGIRELRHHCLPLPDNGEMTFSVWARAVPPGRLTMHIIQDGWGKRAERSCALTEKWQRYTVSWPVPTTREKDWFFVRLDASSNGVPVEIADAQLIWHATGPVAAIEPYAAARKLGWQGAPGPNLLYNPDLELGGTGYFYDFSWPKNYKDYETVRHAAPIELLEGQGVDGGTCAWLREGTVMRPYCFPVTVGQTYTVSADLRAPAGQTSADCQVMVFDPEWKCALASRAANIPGTAWKRYHWTFTWKTECLQKRGYVRFNSANTLIDRIQVVAGDSEAYQAPPVMLGLVYDRWPYFVRGRDVPRAQVKIVPGVYGAGTATVTVAASDAWGREVWTQALKAPLDRVALLPVDLPVKKLGVFHLHLTATVGGAVAGIGIGRYAILDPVVRPSSSPGRLGTAGICQESFNFPVWLCEDHAKIQSDLGIRFNRFFAAVPPDLPTPIPAEWATDLKAKCKPFREAGIDVMPCVDVIPASVAKDTQNTSMPRPADLDAYGNHLREYVEALRPEVTFWEIFNEPNLWRVPSGPEAGKPTMYPLKYFEFQKVAYRTIKAIDPNLRVVCNALNNVHVDWIEEWMKAGGGAYMDIFSFHPYAITDFFEQGLQLEKTMQGLNFHGPLVNSERYYGANLFYDRAGYEETRRDYYLPYDGELQTAGRSIQHFVSSLAVGVPVSFFNPGGTLFSRGPARELFLYDFFGAYNTAIRMVAGAGRAERIEMGPSVSALLFPQAEGGPLVVLWTPMLNAEGSLRLSGTFAAYDIMGNPVDAAPRDGVRIATDPSYIRFNPKNSAGTVRTLMAQAEVRGLGDPVRVTVTATGRHRLSAWVTNLRNSTFNGRVRLVNVPAAWGADGAAQAVTGVLVGQTVRVDFVVPGVEFENLGEYPVTVIAESGEEFVRRDSVLRPLFAHRMGEVKTDGDLAEWSGATWVPLGETNLSRDFGPAFKHWGGKDLSARFAVGWSPEALSLAIVVTDDHHVPAPSPMVGWAGDSVQVYFDPRHDAAVDAPHISDNIEYICSCIGGTNVAWLAKGAEGNYKGVANKVEGLVDRDVHLAVVRRDGETIYEMSFPRRACLPDATLAADSSLGFALLINDNDGEGRKVGLTLTPKGTEPYGVPHLYRDLILAP